MIKTTIDTSTAPAWLGEYLESPYWVCRKPKNFDPKLKKELSKGFLALFRSESEAVEYASRYEAKPEPQRTTLEERIEEARKYDRPGVHVLVKCGSSWKVEAEYLV